MRRITALVLCAGLTASVLGACARPQSVGSVEEPGDPVTLEQVQLILDGIDAVFSQAMKVLVRDRRVTAEYVELMAAIYDEKALNVVLEMSRRQAENARLRHLRPAPGELETKAIHIISTGPDCLYVQVDYDLTGILLSELVFARVGLIVLRPEPAGRDVRDVNPTDWLVDEFKIPTEQGAVDQYPCHPDDALEGEPPPAPAGTTALTTP